MSGGGYQYQDYWERMHQAGAGRLCTVGYRELGEGFNAVAYRQRLAAVERVLDRNRCATARVVEAAVGVGAYGPLWQALGTAEWIGVDISAAAVRDLAARFPRHRFVQADLSAADLAARLGLDGGADLVTAIDVLYHVTDDGLFAQALRNLGGLVRPGGALLCTDVFVEQARLTAPHVRRRPLGRYEELLAPLGLRRIDREPVFALLGDPVPREGGPLADRLLFTGWRVLAKALRTLPARLRSPAGAALATALSPLDALLRGAGLARGVNLEIALFRRDPL